MFVIHFGCMCVCLIYKHGKHYSTFHIQMYNKKCLYIHAKKKMWGRKVYIMIYIEKNIFMYREGS